MSVTARYDIALLFAWLASFHFIQTLMHKIPTEVHPPHVLDTDITASTLALFQELQCPPHPHPHPTSNGVLREALGRVERREDKFSNFQVIQTP